MRLIETVAVAAMIWVKSRIVGGDRAFGTELRRHSDNSMSGPWKFVNALPVYDVVRV